jgi:hypothetical protein
LTWEYLYLYSSSLLIINLYIYPYTLISSLICVYKVISMTIWIIIVFFLYLKYNKKLIVHLFSSFFKSSYSFYFLFLIIVMTFHFLNFFSKHSLFWWFISKLLKLFFNGSVWRCVLFQLLLLSHHLLLL